MIVTPPCSAGPTRDELVFDTEVAVRKAVEVLRPKAAVGADWIPTVNISWFQCITVPSLFGAQPVYPEGSEPIVTPVFSSADEAAEAGTPPIDGPVLEHMLSTLDTALRSLPDDFSLSFPPVASPFDLAQLLLPGDEFLVSLITAPEAALTFLDNLAQLCLGVLAITRNRVTGTPSEFVTNRGLWFPGLRLACDALVNWPPYCIRNTAWPILQRFGERYGKLCVHYCSKPAPSAHVLPALCECESVSAVDTWQGPDAFIGDEAPRRMQSRVALIFDVDLTNTAKMTSFLEREPIRNVPRKHGRGLVLHTSAPSVDEAKQIYQTWLAKTEE